MIPKNHNRKFYWYKPNSEIREHKTIFLRYLNQKITFQIYDDTFYYYIETFLELPYYSKNERNWLRKQLEWYTLKLLKEGKLANCMTTDKITQNIKKNFKNNYYRSHFHKGFYSILILLSEEQKVKWLIGKIDLRYDKSEIPFFHNVRLMVNGKLVILNRNINDYLGNEFSNFEELFYTFLYFGLEMNGITIRDITTLELVSLECSRELNEFDKTNNRDIPILRNGKGNKRHLGYIGYENYYDYIDYSSIDDYGNNKPEYEIDYVNRKQKTIPQIIRELGYLLDFKPIIDNDIIEIKNFDIRASIENKSNPKNAIATFKKSLYKSNQAYSLRELAHYTNYWLIVNKT